MKKELRPFHDNVSCDVCGRTMLKGERTETYLAPGGHRNLVCELCFVRAEHAGWIRESAADAMPARGPRMQDRGSLLGRLRLRRGEAGAEDDGTPIDDRQTYEEGPPDPLPGNGDGAVPDTRRRAAPQDPRHVRAVPTTAEVKVERALDLFNGSEHQRTVAGLTRTLGVPWISANPDGAAPSTVTVVVAWELSWYRYRVDLGDAADPVVMLDKGDEIADIADDSPDWNAGLDTEGRIVVGVAGE
jgi:hypothetical protein